MKLEFGVTVVSQFLLGLGVPPGAHSLNCSLTLSGWEDQQWKSWVE
jgi:hypothetical protein